MEISVKRDPLWAAVNIWKVRYQVRINRKLETREKYVVGLNACSGKESELEASVAVAAVYGGKSVRILDVSFIATGVKAGFEWELQKEYWKGQHERKN